MKRKRFTEEQIIRVLEELKQGIPLLELARKYNVTDWTIYRWKHKYGEMSASEIHRLKKLEEEKGGNMVKKGYTPEQVIKKLREAEIILSQGSGIIEASRKIGVTEQTYYRWRKEYGGMRVEQARRLKDLEKENARLKKLVADLSLDNSILKEAARGNF